MRWRSIQRSPRSHDNAGSTWSTIRVNRCHAAQASASPANPSRTATSCARAVSTPKNRPPFASHCSIRHASGHGSDAPRNGRITHSANWRCHALERAPMLRGREITAALSTGRVSRIRGFTERFRHATDARDARDRARASCRARSARARRCRTGARLPGSTACARMKYLPGSSGSAGKREREFEAMVAGLARSARRPCPSRRRIPACHPRARRRSRSPARGRRANRRRRAA